MFTYITIVRSLDEKIQEKIYNICENPNIENVIIINNGNDKQLPPIETKRKVPNIVFV